MNELKEYDNKSLSDYKKKHFEHDRRKYGLSNLQPSDLKDLEQELNLTCAELLSSQTYLKANNVYQYCRTAYQNAVRRFSGDFIRNSEINYMEHKDLSNFINSHSWDNEVDRAPYWKWDILQGLTEIEQDILVLKVNDFRYEEIKRLIKYSGTLSGLRNVYERAKKKVLAIHPLLAQKLGL